MYVCSCFGITEQQVRAHADAGSCTPRQIASASKAGTDCGSCVRRIQGILGRGSCPRREVSADEAATVPAAVPAALPADRALPEIAAPAAVRAPAA
ncbi:bacterioferritin-associated ferredoxin [Streptomyces sp. TR06-5]|uniref:(2Fe-2S)-binding protein n=1 Tax=unclassified Streptomyces TaxID=2593676 RepID=UPI0039A2D8F9